MIVVWRVTERCNLSCKFCAYDRDVIRARHDADPENILFFGSLLAEYQKATGNSVLVSWLGGEPLLWSPLTQLTEAFTRNFRLQVSTTTNGTSLSSTRMRAHLLDCYSELTISVDGLASFHNASRGWNNGFETLRRSVRLLASEKKLRDRGPLLRANVVLMRDNVGQFQELCMELCDWGIEEITFNQLGGIDRPEFYPNHRLQQQDAVWLEDQFGSLAKDLKARGVCLRGNEGYLGRISATTKDIPLPIVDCHPGKSFLFINERGRIAPCNFTSEEYGIDLDDFHSLNDLRQIPVRFSQMRKNYRSTFCDDCHSTHVFKKFTT